MRKKHFKTASNSIDSNSLQTTRKQGRTIVTAYKDTDSATANVSEDRHHYFSSTQMRSKTAQPQPYDAMFQSQESIYDQWIMSSREKGEANGNGMFTASNSINNTNSCCTSIKQNAWNQQSYYQRLSQNQDQQNGNQWLIINNDKDIQQNRMIRSEHILNPDCFVINSTDSEADTPNKPNRNPKDHNDNSHNNMLQNYTAKSKIQPQLFQNNQMANDNVCCTKGNDKNVVNHNNLARSTHSMMNNGHYQHQSSTIKRSLNMNNNYQNLTAGFQTKLNHDHHEGSQNVQQQKQYIDQKLESICKKVQGQLQMQDCHHNNKQNKCLNDKRSIKSRIVNKDQHLHFNTNNRNPQQQLFHSYQRQGQKEQHIQPQPSTQKQKLAQKQSLIEQLQNAVDSLRQNNISMEKRFLKRENELLTLIENLQNELDWRIQQSQNQMQRLVLLEKENQSFKNQIAKNTRANSLLLSQQPMVNIQIDDNQNDSNKEQLPLYMPKIQEFKQRILNGLKQGKTMYQGWHGLMERTISSELPGTAFRVKEELGLQKDFFDSLICYVKDFNKNGKNSKKISENAFVAQSNSMTTKTNSKTSTKKKCKKGATASNTGVNSNQEDEFLMIKVSSQNPSQTNHPLNESCQDFLLLESYQTVVDDHNKECKKAKAGVIRKSLQVPPRSSFGTRLVNSRTKSKSSKNNLVLKGSHQPPNRQYSSNRNSLKRDSSNLMSGKDLTKGKNKKLKNHNSCMNKKDKNIVSSKSSACLMTKQNDQGKDCYQEDTNNNNKEKQSLSSINKTKDDINRLKIKKQQSSSYTNNNCQDNRNLPIKQLFLDAASQSSKLMMSCDEGCCKADKSKGQMIKIADIDTFEGIEESKVNEVKLTKQNGLCSRKQANYRNSRTNNDYQLLMSIDDIDMYRVLCLQARSIEELVIGANSVIC